MRILVTSGATREPIDRVRFITNFSTGETGAAIASHFARLGHQVTYLHGEGAAMPSAECEWVRYSDFESLDRELRRLLSEHDFNHVIHLAAVSDYSVESIVMGGERYSPGRVGKIDSSQPVTLELKPNFKIVGRIQGYAGGRAPAVTAFKLTDTASERERLAAIGKLARLPGVRWVVHNDCSDIAEKRREFVIYQGAEAILHCSGREALAEGLESVFRRSQR